MADKKTAREELDSLGLNKAKEAYTEEMERCHAKVDTSLRLARPDSVELAQSAMETIKVTWPTVAEDANRGRKTIDSAKAGHEAVHGTEGEKKARWSSYQAKLEEIHRENTEEKIGVIQQKTAVFFGVDERTIRRHTKKTW